MAYAMFDLVAIEADEAPWDKLHISSPAAYLVDEESGKVLYEKGAREARPIASTTKIMTALLVLEKARLDDRVPVSANAASTGGAVIGLRAGEARTVNELLHALMVASANDAAEVLAEYVGGSRAGFAAIMNTRAKELGAETTKFESPHGLSSGRMHYSSAKDLALIALEAMKRPDFRALVSTRRFSWETTVSAKPRLLTNSNHLLERYPAATGIKTGYTNESGYCLVASAVKGKRSAIAVILGSSSREASFNDARGLLDAALNNYGLRQIVRKNHRYGVLRRFGKSVPLIAGGTVAGLVYNGDDGPIVLRTKLRHDLRLPIKKGDSMGRLAISQMGQKLGQVELLAGRSVPAPYRTGNLTDVFWRVVKKMKNLF